MPPDPIQVSSVSIECGLKAAPRSFMLPTVRKAILYAAGGQADLYPSTSALPKGLLPVFDKPLVYYSLSVLMLAGLRRIAIVTSDRERASFERLLEDGSQFGIELEYLTQDDSAGAAQSFLTASDFIGRDPIAMILGDCLLYGDGLQQVLNEAAAAPAGARVFAHPVGNPQRHAIVDLAPDGSPRSIEDGPLHSKSNLAVMGVSFYDCEIVKMAAELRALRGDASTMSDIHRAYLERGALFVRAFGRGFAWLDTSTHAAFAAAANFIETIESTHGLKIGCLEEIAYLKGFITAQQLEQAGAQLNNAYGEYLQKIALAGKGPCR